jgi:hypothetical protein
METAQLNSTQNGHSKAITDINQVTKSSKVNVPEPIDTIEFLLKTRTGNDIADWNNILQACQLIFDKYQCNYLPVVNKKYFTTKVECCYCGLKNDAKFNISQIKNYINLNVRSIPKLFVIDCHNADCPGNIALKNEWRSIRVKSTWRPTDGTWLTKSTKNFTSKKRKKKSTISAQNAAFSSKIIQPTDSSLNYTLLELHHRVSSEKILSKIQAKQYSAVLQDLANQIEVYTKLLELL